VSSTQPTDTVEIDVCTVAGIACLFDDFSTLCNALKVTGLDVTLGTMTEDPSTVFTVFAPTNAAFAELGDATLAYLVNVNPTLLTEMLLFHVVTSQVLTSDDLECSGLVVRSHL
jgi:transforming growth factor-beta-induced protein